MSDPVFNEFYYIGVGPPTIGGEAMEPDGDPASDSPPVGIVLGFGLGPNTIFGDDTAYTRLDV